MNNIENAINLLREKFSNCDFKDEIYTIVQEKINEKIKEVESETGIAEDDDETSGEAWYDEVRDDLMEEGYNIICSWLNNNQGFSPDIRVLMFDSVNYDRSELSKMSDVEKYFLWLGRDEVKGYTLDEFSANFNDEAVDTQAWIYFIDIKDMEAKIETGEADVQLYKVWSDSESAFEVPDDAPCIFKSLDAADSYACNLAHRYDGEAERAIFHVENMFDDETIITYENANNCCDR